MDEHAGKIVSFLKMNPNLDLQASDIAYHLAMDDNYVQNTLNALYHKGHVTARQNDEGRIFWYCSSGVNQQSEKKGSLDLDRLDSLSGGGFPVAQIITTAIILGIIGAGAYFGKNYFDKKMKRMSETISSSVVTNDDYQPFKKRSVEKITQLENEVKALTVKVDSLKTTVAELSKKPPAISKPVRKTTRRR